MSTPTRKGSSMFSIPMDRTRRSKFFSNPRNPRASDLEEESSGGGGGSMGEAEVWRRFSDAGLLDESELRRKDRQVLVDRIEQLEKELYDYQYHMGLLLIEKDKEASEYGDIKQRLAETEAIFKREHTSHFTAMSESAKQVENIQKALVVEKQCVKDLEEALLKMSAEITGSKLMSDNKLVKVHSLEINNGKKHLQTRNELQEDSTLQNESTSYIIEEREQGEDFSFKSDDQLAWEIRLLEGQQKLDEDDINTRLQILAAKEKVFDSKQTDLEKKERDLLVREEKLAARERDFDSKQTDLEKKEKDFLVREERLAARERDFDSKQTDLEKKEKDLLVREERLAARERAEIQKLLDDHTLSLESKKHKLELEKNQKSIEEDLKDKMDALEKKKTEINCREDQTSKREHALERKMEKLKDKEDEINTMLRLLKENEESLHIDGQKLKAGKEQLAIDIHNLKISKAKLENSRSAMKAEEQKVIRERENLKIAQLDVKQELDNCRIMKESLMKETKDLMHGKNNFDRELEALETRRVVLETELKQLNDEKKAFNDWRQIEEEKLKSESLKVSVDIQHELQEFKLKKNDFESGMRMVKELEEKLCERDGEIERVMVINQNLMKLFSCSDESDLQKLEIDHDSLARKEKETSPKRRKLDTDQRRENLVDEQEEFIKERDHSPSLAEVCKTCKNCGVTVSELDEPVLQIPNSTSIRKNFLLEQHMDGSSSVILGGHFPSLRKCPLLFNSSPGEIVAHPIEGSSKFISLKGEETSEGKIDFGLDRAKSIIGVGDSGLSESLCTDGDTKKSEDKPNISSIDIEDKRDEAESQILSSKQRGGHQGRRRGRPKTIRRNSIDTEAIIGENSEGNRQQADETTEDSVVFTERIQEDRKRKQTSSGTPTSAEKHYNFRQSTINRRRWA